MSNVRATYFSRIAIVLSWLMVAAHINGQGDSNLQAATVKLADHVYVDSKEYFRIRPPASWHVEEYKGDPRGKVKFICPDNRNVTLIVLGMATDMETYEALLDDSKQQASRIKAKYSAFNPIGTTETITFDNAPAVRGTLTLAGRIRQYSLEFLRGKTYFMLSYAAPPELYDKHLAVVMQSMNTIDPLSKDVTGKDAIACLIASKKRLAQLNLKMGFVDVALRAVEEGLAVDPTNKELIQLRDKIRSIKRE